MGNRPGQLIPVSPPCDFKPSKLTYSATQKGFNSRSSQYRCYTFYPDGTYYFCSSWDYGDTGGTDYEVGVYTVDKKKQTVTVRSVDRHNVEVSLRLFSRVFTAKDPSKPVTPKEKVYALSAEGYAQIPDTEAYSRQACAPKDTAFKLYQ